MVTRLVLAINEIETSVPFPEDGNARVSYQEVLGSNKTSYVCEAQRYMI